MYSDSLIVLLHGSGAEESLFHHAVHITVSDVHQKRVFSYKGPRDLHSQVMGYQSQCIKQRSLQYRSSKSKVQNKEEEEMKVYIEIQGGGAAPALSNTRSQQGAHNRQRSELACLGIHAS